MTKVSPFRAPPLYCFRENRFPLREALKAFLSHLLFLFPLFSKKKKKKQVAKLVHDQELSVEERNLLSVAFKNVIGEFRVSGFFAFWL